jgi:uncharacterized repeat protein (TIGR01451 family)
LIKKRFLLGLAVATIAAAACGGGGGSAVPGSTANAPIVVPPGGSAATNAPVVSMALTVTIPKKTTASRARGPQYIAPGSGSMTMTLLTVNGANVQAAAPAQGPFNLTTTNNPACVAGANSTVCTFTISAPIGTDIFLANTFATSNATGQPLGSGSILLSVRQNAQNSANLSLTGPVASVQLVSAQTTLFNGNPPVEDQGYSITRTHGKVASAARLAARTANIAAAKAKAAATTRKTPLVSATAPPLPSTMTASRLFVIALDAAGNQIINPTTFDIPITLTLSLNGTPAGNVSLNVAYAGLTGEPTTAATTSSDNGTVGVFAPSDIVTMTISATSTLGSTFTPSVVASYTPQQGTLQTTAPLTFSVMNPPAAAFLVASATHIDPFSANVPAQLTMTVGNSGTAATSGTTSVQIDDGEGFTFIDKNAASDPSWTCSDLGFAIECDTSAAIAPGANLPLVLDVNPSCCSAINFMNVFGGNAANTNDGPGLADFISVNSTSTPFLALSVQENTGNTFYATVPGTYVITLRNNGTQDTSGPITVTDTLPGNFTFNSGTGMTCGGTEPTITCTTSAVVPALGGTATATLNVTPSQAIVDTNPQNTVSASGGGAPNNPTVTTVSGATFVSSPITFSVAGTTNPYNPASTTHVPVKFAAGDGATLEIGATSSSGLTGFVSVNTQSASSTSYMVVDDSCTPGSVIDGIFAGSFSPPLAVGSVGTPQDVQLDVNPSAAPETCAVTIQDTVGNEATLNILVNQSTLVIQGHRRKSGSTR